MIRNRRLFHRTQRIGKPAIAAALLIICQMLLTACATVPPDIDESLRRDALAGNVQAQYEIGQRYDESARWGWGNSHHWDEAAVWYAMAAEQGDARAQYHLANHCFSRLKDYSRSFRLNQLAAGQGLAEAQYSLAMHYAQAWGTEQDLVLAYKWIATANAGGLSGGSLADTEWLVWKGKMSADQVAAGRRLAAEHTAAHGKSWSIREKDKY